jgi:hypothetical protein
MHIGMRFFNRGSHGLGKNGRGNLNRGPRKPRFSIHFDADSQELRQLFKYRFFNSIGQGVIQPRPERPPFQAPHVPSILVPPHVSLQPEVPKNDGWQDISHRTVSQHHGWPNLPLPTPPPVNQIVQVAPTHSLVQSSHTRKRLKTKSHHVLDKGKFFFSLSSPSNDSVKSMSSHMHLRDYFSHVMSDIRPKVSTQPKGNSEKSKGDSRNKGKIASQSGRYGF